MSENPVENSVARGLRATSRATSLTLLAGVILSCGLLVLGLIKAAVGGSVPTLLHPAAISEHFRGVTSGDPVSIVHLGLLVLMCTPIARVIVLAIEFFANREFSFAAVSLCVLFLLATGIFAGLI